MLFLATADSPVDPAQESFDHHVGAELVSRDVWGGVNDILEAKNRFVSADTVHRYNSNSYSNTGHPPQIFFDSPQRFCQPGIRTGLDEVHANLNDN